MDLSSPARLIEFRPDIHTNALFFLKSKTALQKFSLADSSMFFCSQSEIKSWSSSMVLNYHLLIATSGTGCSHKQYSNPASFFETRVIYIKKFIYFARQKQILTLAPQETF